MYFQPETKSMFQTHSEFRSAFPDTSFPVQLTDEIMQAFGVFPITKSTPTYDPMTHKAQQMQPVQVNGVWTQTWEVVALTEDEIDTRNAAQAASVRAERNQKLADSDWTQLADSTADKAAWATYRQALRDVTAQEGFPWAIIWPTQPE